MLGRNQTCPRRRYRACGSSPEQIRPGEGQEKSLNGPRGGRKGSEVEVMWGAEGQVTEAGLEDCGPEAPQGSAHTERRDPEGPPGSPRAHQRRF